MTDAAKITLSTKELELVCNTDWILTKHRIIEKVYHFFGEVSVNMKQFIDSSTNRLPKEVFDKNAKISKGENYRRLPYVMLDYPRHFSKESTLAIRTFFWWGNFFSINLQVSGEYKETVAPALLNQFLFLQEHNYSLCIHSDPWQHHFDEDNYVPIRNMTVAEFSTILSRESFIKIAKRISLQQWSTASIFIESSFKEMITLLELRLLSDETGP